MIRTQTPTSVYSVDDPLALAIRPPTGESEYERQSRLKAETEAKLRSDQIDEEIKQEEREKSKRRRNEVKLLLLGQAESGKSTLQKQFQLLYAPASLDVERSSWRTVVYFNIVRTIRRIFEAVEGIDLEMVLEGRLSPNEQSTRLDTSAGSPLLAEIADIKQRLSMASSTEALLGDRLSGGVQIAESARRRGDSIYVRSGWQAQALIKGRDNKNVGAAADAQSTLEADDELDRIASLLNQNSSDIKNLWANPIVQALIGKRKLRLDESADFFLNDIDRVSSTNYIPSTDDILHARLQTMGIVSHTFTMTLHGKPVEWRLYDVGGTRGQRHTWVPYFDDANAIIFIAPVSAFDQYLEEDSKVNRIHDSLQLFSFICANPLLKSVHLVLFLNKTDILKAKIASGIQVRKYITSYGERPNDYDHVVDYFRSHFVQAHRKTNDQGRVLYTHFTSVVDTKTTHSIITNVRDSVFRSYLQDASLV